LAIAGRRVFVLSSGEQFSEEMEHKEETIFKYKTKGRAK